MFNAFERMVAARYLRARKGERFVSVIAIFSLIGIALGVATLIIVMSVMNGFREELLSRILGVNGDLAIYSAGAPLTEFDDIDARIAKLPGVVSVMPVVEGQALLTADNGGAFGGLVRGVRQEDLRKLKVVAGNIRAGSLDDFQGNDAVAIGVGLAQRLGLTVGGRITLLSPQGQATAFGTVPRSKAYTVVALFQVGFQEADTSFVYLPLAAAQVYFQVRNAATQIEVMTDNPDQVSVVNRDIRGVLAGGPVRVVDWTQANNSFFAAVEVERNVMFLILTLIILVAAFNVISSLIMMVKDKTRDIAVLRTIGAGSGSVLRIFLMCGAFVGVAGTTVGALLGIVFCVNIERIRHVLEGLTGTNLFNPEVYFLSRLPAKLDWAEVSQVILMALIISLLATVYPSWRAARTDPVKRCAMSETVALRMRGVKRTYRSGGGELPILRGANFELRAGEIVALVAPSGAGKSTFLHLAGLLEKPDGGQVFIGGRDAGALSDAERTAIRRDSIGFVYQFHHLLGEFSALENVVLPQLIRGTERHAAEARAELLLGAFGLASRMRHLPGKLSGGEQQRVAIARALANAPKLMLADEPTGNLDSATAAGVFDELLATVRHHGVAALIATHNTELAARMDRTVTLRDGLVVG